jgi:putative oxidoreductase
MCTYTYLPKEALVDEGLLVLHVWVGAVLLAHGIQKWTRFGVDGTAGYLESVGLRRAPRLMAAAVIASETIGGALVGLGLFTAAGAVIVAGTMLVASRTGHRGKGFWITGPGSEYVLTQFTAAVVLAATGPGRFSLDRALGIGVHGAWYGVAVAALAAAGAGTVLALFRRDGAEAPAPATT